MARYYQRPENALKKANEFIEVGKPTRALDTLYDVIKGKKHRNFSEKVIEPIMLKYLELCVELKKPHTAKEGLYQYRVMCQSVNVGLLEKVIRAFIRMAEEKTEAAKEALKKENPEKDVNEDVNQGIVEVDDLDNLSMAEMTLLNVITEEQAQERSDRAALIPWVKFLWESYTQCLDLLRNNARLEMLYHDIAQMAFKFCLSFNRKTEFRKLCERLRKHFDDILARQGTQMNTIDFSSPETQQLNMETRLHQLDSAITLELWQEAYKAIEDIHLLMNQSKKLQTRMMAYYYQKLSLVFWKAGNLLFHAATLLKYYLLCKDMKKNISPEELQKNASQVALATLAIPFPVAHPEFERFVETDKGMIEKSQKLSMLLFLPQPPTKSSLIKDMLRYGVLNNSIPPLTDLYEVLETQFNPLDLCTQVQNCLNNLKTFADHDYIGQYIEPVQDVAMCRLIKQISQVYQNIDYNHLLKLAVFASLPKIEQLLVDAVRFNDMQIMIDHRTNCVKFGSTISEDYGEDGIEGVRLQAMPSETIRLQLVHVADYLDETIDMIRPSDIFEREETIKKKIIGHYLSTEKTSHRALLQRQEIIANRREELERSAHDRENEEKWRSEQMMKHQLAVEAERVKTEREERERRRIEMEMKKIQTDRLVERFNQLKSSPFGVKVMPRLEDEDMGKIDMESVIQQQQAEMAREAKEQLARMRAQEKRMDHLERAKRLEEVPVIKKYVDDKKTLEKREWEAHEGERISHLIEERKIAVSTRDRMKRMREEKNKFLSALLESRRHIYVEKVKSFEENLAYLRAERLQRRKQDRKEERQMKYRQQIEEEERRREEEIRRVEEERMKEEKAKVDKELEEKNRIVYEKQMAKLREIEEREDRDKRASISPAGVGGGVGGGENVEPWRPSRLSSGVTPTPTAAAAPAPKSGVWVPKSRLKLVEVQDTPENVRNLRGPEPRDMEPRRIDMDRSEREPRSDREPRRIDDRDREPRRLDDRDRSSFGPGPTTPRSGSGGGPPSGRDRVMMEDSWRRGPGSASAGSGSRPGTAGSEASPRSTGAPPTSGRRGGGERERERDGGFPDDGNWRRTARKEETPIRK